MLDAARRAERPWATGLTPVAGERGRGEERHLERALELLPVALAVVARDGAIVAGNRAFERLLGGGSIPGSCCELLGCGADGDTSWTGCLTRAMLHGGRRSMRARSTAGALPGVMWIAACRPAGDSDHVILRIRADDEAHDDRTVARLPGAHRLRIRVLGTTGVECDGGTLDDAPWLEQRPGMLLKFLVATRGRAVPADEIAEALWPRQGLEGSGAVRHAVHLLRRRLGDPRFIRTQRGAYLLDLSSVWVDADAFETATRTGLDAYLSGSAETAARSLEHALRLYRGDFLADEPYADWAVNERERLRSLVHIPLRVLADLRLAADDFQGAANYIEQLAAMEPFDADIHRLLLEIWLRQGRRSRVLRHFEVFAARMLREFGEAPPFTVADALHSADRPLHAL